MPEVGQNETQEAQDSQAQHRKAQRKHEMKRARPQLWDPRFPRQVDSDEDKPLMRFRLLAGRHVGQDYSKSPKKFTDDHGNESTVYPPKVFQRGEVVTSKTDLVQVLGANKFERLEDGARGMKGKRNDAVQEERPADPFRGGQVIQGHQVTVSGPGGEPIATVAQERPPFPETDTGGEKPTPYRAAPQGTASTQSPATRNTADVEDNDDEDEGTEERGQTSSEAEDETPTGKQSLDQEYGQLDSRSVAELKEIAEVEEIDLAGARSKHDIIKALRTAKR